MGDDRNVVSDNLHQMAALIIQGSRGHHGVIRNLSAKGVMFEGSCTLVRGERVAVEIPGLGWAHATVAWALTPRSGISFDEPLPDDRVELLRQQLTLSIVRGDFPLVDEEEAAEADLRPGFVGDQPDPRIVEIDSGHYFAGKPSFGNTMFERIDRARMLEAL
ncbi:MAG TPA: PilZ domain-containing protein [Novosphingobium sp.]